MKNILRILTLLSLLACGTDKPKEPENKPENEHLLELTTKQLANLKLSVVQMQEQSVDEKLSLNGKIDVPPQNLISVSSALGGYLKSTQLLPGMHFKKGQLIAVMEDQSYIQLQQEALNNRLKLQQAKQEMQRQKDLNQSKATSDKNYLQAKTDYEILLIEQAALQQKLKLINIDAGKITSANLQSSANIYAPFDGFVSRVFVNVGQYVSSATVLFELVNPRDIHLNLKVFEKDFGKLHIGQQLLAYTNSQPTQKHRAKVIVISKNLAQDHSLDLHAHFDKYDASLVPGMYMNAELMIAGPKTWALPQESIQLFEGQHYVFEQMNRQQYRLWPVKIGLENKEVAQIISYKNLVGKNIVKQGAYTLLMALKNKSEE